MYDTLRYECRGEIALVTLDRPGALNAISMQMLMELRAVFEDIAQDPHIRVVILTGEGKAFVAGADIDEMSRLTGVEGHEMIRYGASLMNLIEDLSVPVIAAVNGFALGGGCELSMACDIRIASEKAQFGQPETGLGIIPGFGGTQRLTRLVGKGMAKYLIFTGEYISAQEALRLGLVEKVTAPGELMDVCMDLARTIISKAPIAVAAAKNVINRGFMLDMKTAAALETEAFTLPFCSEDRVEGLTSFIEKRKPVFRGR